MASVGFAAIKMSGANVMITIYSQPAAGPGVLADFLGGFAFISDQS
jgi:hypothetical protein